MSLISSGVSEDKHAAQLESRRMDLSVSVTCLACVVNMLKVVYI